MHHSSSTSPAGTKTRITIIYFHLCSPPPRPPHQHLTRTLLQRLYSHYFTPLLITVVVLPSASSARRAPERPPRPHIRHGASTRVRHKEKKISKNVSHHFVAGGGGGEENYEDKEERRRRGRRGRRRNEEERSLTLNLFSRPPPPFNSKHRLLCGRG